MTHMFQSFLLSTSYHLRVQHAFPCAHTRIDRNIDLRLGKKYEPFRGFDDSLLEISQLFFEAC